MNLVSGRKLMIGPKPPDFFGTVKYLLTCFTEHGSTDSIASFCNSKLTSFSRTSFLDVDLGAVIGTCDCVGSRMKGILSPSTLFEIDSLFVKLNQVFIKCLVLPAVCRVSFGFF